MEKRDRVGPVRLCTQSTRQRHGGSLPLEESGWHELFRLFLNVACVVPRRSDPTS